MPGSQNMAVVIPHSRGVDLPAGQLAGKLHNIPRLPWQTVSNASESLSSTRLLPLPLGAQWMNSRDSTKSGESNKPAKNTQKDVTTACLLPPEHGYLSPLYPSVELQTTTPDIKQYLTYDDYIRQSLPQLQKSFADSQKYHLSKFASDCKKIINMKESVQVKLRQNADEAWHEHKAHLNDMITHLNDDKLQDLLDKIGAICEPCPPQLDEFWQTLAHLYQSAMATDDYIFLWEYIKGHQQLQSHLSRSMLGKSVLEEIRTLLRVNDELNSFTVQQQELMEKIEALCFPSTGKNIHQLCDVDLTGKSVQLIVHSLLNNSGIEEILNGSSYGLKLWHELENYPTSIRMLNSRKRMEDNIKKINETQQSLDKLKDLSRFRRMFNFFNIQNKKASIIELTNTLNFRLKSSEDIILSQDAFFRTLQQIRGSGTDSTLKALLNKNVTLQNTISRAVALQECAEQIAPTLLLNPESCAEFVAIASALTACQQFSTNIHSLDNSLFKAMAQLYPKANEVIKFANSLKNSKEDQGIILAASVFMPPHLSWDERKHELTLLSKVISARHRPSHPSPNPQRQYYISHAEQWCGLYADQIDEQAREDIVNIWFNHQQNAKKPVQLYEQLTKRLSDNLAIKKLEMVLKNDIILDGNLVRKLNITHDKTEKIKEAMINFMFSKDDYIDEKTKKAEFNLKIAEITELLAVKLASDLKKINLTNAHYNSNHADSSDLLITRAHLEEVDHLAILHAALNDIFVISHSLDELRSLYEYVYVDADDIQILIDIMEETLFNDADCINEFHQQVNDIFDSDEMTGLGTFQRTIAERILTIRDELLSFSPHSLTAFFATLDKSGIRLTPDSKTALQEKIREVLFNNTAEEEKNTLTVLSFLLHQIFSSGRLVNLQEKQLKGQPHEFLQQFNDQLSRQLTGLIDSELTRILAPFADSFAGGMGYINASCKLIGKDDNHDNHFAIINNSFDNIGYTNNPLLLSQKELAYVKSVLHTIIASGQVDIRASINEIVQSLRSQRETATLKSLGNVFHWYQFLKSQRLNYANADNDALREDIIKRIYKRANSLSVKNFSSEFSTVLNTEHSLPDAKTFIQQVDAACRVSETVMHHIILLSNHIEDAAQELNDDVSREVKKANDEIQSQYAMALHRYSNDIAEHEYKTEKIKNDYYYDYFKQAEYDYKYQLRESHQQYYDAVLATAALQREFNWSYESDVRKLRLKMEAGGKTSRYLQHLWDKRNFYLVFERKKELNTRVVIKDNSGPVTKHITIDGTAPKENDETTYFTVPIKQEYFDDERFMLEIQSNSTDFQQRLNDADDRHPMVPRKETWFFDNTDETVPVVDGFRLMKIIAEETGKKNYELIKIVGSRREVPSHTLRPPADLKQIVDTLKEQYLYHPNVSPQNVQIKAPTLPIGLDDVATAAGKFATTAMPPLHRPSVAASPVAAMPLPMTKPLAMPMPAPANTPVAVSAATIALAYPSSAPAKPVDAVSPAVKPNFLFEKAFPASVPALAVPPAVPLPPTPRDMRTSIAGMSPPAAKSHPIAQVRTDIAARLARQNSAAANHHLLFRHEGAASIAQMPAGLPEAAQTSGKIAAGSRGTHPPLARTYSDLYPWMQRSSAETTISANSCRRIKNQPYFAATGYADCLLFSLVQHMNQIYQPDDGNNRLWVRHYRHALVERGWHGAAGGFAASGYMGAVSPASFALIEAINRDLLLNHKQPLRVIFHEFSPSPTSASVQEFTEGYGPQNGRTVHILQSTDHFEALLPQSVMHK